MCPSLYPHHFCLGAAFSPCLISGASLRFTLPPLRAHNHLSIYQANPSAVFPRFSYPDVNFWIWVFGRRYRQVVRSWEESVHGPDRAADRRTNWSGAALSTFYQAVRHALVVAIIIRGLATLGGIAGVTWWILRHVNVGGSEL